MDTQQPQTPPTDPVQSQPAASVPPMPAQQTQMPTTPEKTGGKHIGLFFIGVVVIIVLIGIVYFVVVSKTNTKTAPQVTTQQSISPTPISSVNSTSDQAINQDLNSVNQSMSSLSQDESSADQGLNDQQTTLN